MASATEDEVYMCDCKKFCGGIPTPRKRTTYFEHRRHRLPMAPPPGLAQPGSSKRTSDNDDANGTGSKRARTLPDEPGHPIPPAMHGARRESLEPENMYDPPPRRNENGEDMDVDPNFAFPPDPGPAEDDPHAAGAGLQGVLEDLDHAAGRRGVDEGSTALDRLVAEIERLELEQRDRQRTPIEEEDADEDEDDADGLWQGPLPDPDRARSPSPAGDRDRHPSTPPRSPSPQEPQPTRFPLSRVPEVLMAQKYLELLDSACLDTERYSGMDAQDRHDLRNPSHERLDISDPKKRLSLNMYTACRNSGGVKTYTEIASGIQAVYPDIPILSFYEVKKLVAKESGIRTVTNDMCKSSCIAFTGYLVGEENEKCPVCNAPRWDPLELERTGKKIPRQTFDTNLIGFSIQAQFGTEEHAEATAYRRREHERLMPEYDEKAFVSMVGDYPSGTAVLDADIPKDDICLMWSGDGFQLWELKQSDCYIYIWILLDLPPHLRYKKEYIIPGAIIPGPNKPQNLDSFLFPGL
ncbi:hypothetical protein PENSPDRAFT_753405 [Peniophora sp. CONT]|nr:hypothetical protein PENSPDRAFT_753405 [Peniophora sp. CONT]